MGLREDGVLAGVIDDEVEHDTQATGFRRGDEEAEVLLEGAGPRLQPFAQNLVIGIRVFDGVEAA